MDDKSFSVKFWSKMFFSCLPSIQHPNDVIWHCSNSDMLLIWWLPNSKAGGFSRHHVEWSRLNWNPFECALVTPFLLIVSALKLLKLNFNCDVMFDCKEKRLKWKARQIIWFNQTITWGSTPRAKASKWLQGTDIKDEFWTKSSLSLSLSFYSLPFI